jgi:anti-sigma B factor antagonist
MTDVLRRAGEGETTSAVLTATSWQVIEGPRRLDALAAAELETLWTARVADNSRMVIDLSETVLLTSAGLALLGKLSRLAKEQDGQLRVAGCSKDVRRVMELARFDQVLTIYPDRAAALADSPQVNGN